MESSRIAIITCFALSAIGVGTDLGLKNQVLVADKTKASALALLSDIEKARLDVEVLDKEKQKDKLVESKETDKVRAFFDSTAKNDAKMDKGPTVGPAKEEPGKGFLDSTYELKWTSSGRTVDKYSREKIAAFLWFIENRTSLFKVTYLKMATDANTRDDMWEPTIQVTQRKPVKADEVEKR